ncbi:MAG: hypothetical protein A2Z14_07945 [Chloroflexi bacterium RBG_16_48_8]|nr:MAG: hypothetical protein A2Z14_07945 [Chloroflexi bacterium RBG_16_48_8]
MTEINLRTYIHEIDDLIEESQHLEEAIAHCRHILKIYPKHIDTYRLLGKAYLESKRFGDAGDIFQRVLSAIPNDFVSHVGMAIIREDEGNLDAAIWHMERSSESQPGNAAIEEELKRLIGKRDGIEPQRVRPTRGALARMYYHGELYSYATTELRTALEQDPDRPDLQLLLADTYWRTDQRLEAADFCGQILEKLPHCFLANQITATLLQASGKPEESAINLRRLIALDPYMAFIENTMDNPGAIEASAVQLEKLSWSPGQPLPSAESTQPDWAASLGVDFKGEGAKVADQEAIPSWLQSQPGPGQRGVTPEVPPIHPFAGAKPPPGADIPDWMRESGWVEGSGEATEGPIDFTEVSEAEKDLLSSDRLLEAADLPSWLSEITSQRPIQEEAAPVPEPPTSKRVIPPEIEESQKLPDWIREISPGAGEVEPEPLDLTSKEEFDIDLSPVERESSVLDFTGEAETEGLEEILAEDEFMEDEIPEYPPWLERSTPGATDTIVTWLGDKSLKDVAPAEDIPTWMRGTGPLEDPSRRQRLTPEQKPSEEPLAAPPPTFKVIREISEDLGEPIPTDELPISAIPMGEQAPEWLDEISDLGDALPVQEPVQPEEAPDWLREASSEAEEMPIMEDTAPPVWLEDLEVEFEDETRVELGEREEVLGMRDRPPDWLSEVIREDILDEEEKVLEKPDWLEGVVEPEMILQEEGVADLEEAPEWLTEMSLVEEVDTSPITGDKEEPPQWLKGLSDTEISLVEEERTEEEPQPEWLTKESFPEPEEKIIAAQETPEWLRELTEAPSEVIKPSDVAFEPAVLGAADQEEEHPDWLQDTGETPSEIEMISAEIPERLPEQTLEDEALPEMEVPDWLRDISAAPSEFEAVKEEGIAEPTVSPSMKEALPKAEIPEWLQEASEARIEAEAVTDETLGEMLEPSIAEETFPRSEVTEWRGEVREALIEGETIHDEISVEIPEPSIKEKALPADEAPIWLEEMEEVPIPEEAAADEWRDKVPAPPTEMRALPAEEAPEWLQEMVGPPAEELTIEESIQVIQEPLPGEEFTSEVEPEEWLRQIDEAASLVDETISAEIAPDRLQEFTETPSDLRMEAPLEVGELPTDLIPAEPVDAAKSPEWIEEAIKPEAVPGEEPEWLKEARLEDAFEAETLAHEKADWIQEIEESQEEAVAFLSEEIQQIKELLSEAEIAPEVIEEEPGWHPEFARDEVEREVAPEPIEMIDSEFHKADFEESFAWLQESAMEVTPEPEMPSEPIKPTYTRKQIEDLTASMEVPMDDDEVFGFLDSLAARETIKEAEPPVREHDLFEPEHVQDLTEEKYIEEHALPEELDESLDWLEQLAAEEPVEDFTPPVFVEGLEDEEEAEIPQWLEEVAERSGEALIPEIGVEKVEGPEEITEEPVPLVSQLSTIETIISKRPSEEVTPYRDRVEEIPEEKLAKPVSFEGSELEKEEWVWELESKQEGISPIKEAPPAIPGSEIQIAKIPDEEISQERAEGKEGVAAPPVEEPVVDPLTQKLSQARRALGSGQIEEALRHYSDLIEEKAEIAAVIQDLRNAIEKTPREAMLWQTLGDALMKGGQLSDAIAAYRRGMEAI